MVRIPQCDCLINYKTNNNDTFSTRSETQAWSFFGESCKIIFFVAKTAKSRDVVAKASSLLR